MGRETPISARADRRLSRSGCRGEALGKDILQRAKALLRVLRPYEIEMHRRSLYTQPIPANTVDPLFLAPEGHEDIAV